MSKPILTKEEADVVVIKHSPQKFPLTISKSAHEFVAHQTSQTKSSFRIDKIVALKTGVLELERASMEEKVEKAALLKLKEMQEDAYKQAYELGLDKGREEALRDHGQAIEEQLNQFTMVVEKISELKVDLFRFNEAHIVRLIYYFARRLALAEISAQPDLITKVVREAIESAQSEEKITVRVSPSDFSYFENMKSALNKEYEIFRKVKFEASEAISSGGCLLQTNYGDVDATIEQRVEKLLNVLDEKLPNVTSSVGGESS